MHEVPGVHRKEIILALPYLGPPSIILKRHLTKLVHKFCTVQNSIQAWVQNIKPVPIQLQGQIPNGV